jgi:hypothetical protein
MGKEVLLLKSTIRQNGRIFTELKCSGYKGHFVGSDGPYCPYASEKSQCYVTKGNSIIIEGNKCAGVCEPWKQELSTENAKVFKSKLSDQPYKIPKPKGLPPV